MSGSPWRSSQMETEADGVSNTVRVTHMRDPADKKGTQHAAQAPQEERMLHAAQGHTKVKLIGTSLSDFRFSLFCMISRGFLHIFHFP